MQTFGREPGNLVPAFLLALMMFFVARAVLPERMLLTVPEAQAENGAVAGIGQTVANGYPFDRQTAAFRGSSGSADTLTNAGILATTEFALGGRQNLAVSVRHSAAGATQKIRVLLIWKNPSTGTNYPLTLSDEVTFTANANSIPDGDGNYYSQPYVFCTFGASHARIIRSAAASSGTNTIWAGSF